MADLDLRFHTWRDDRNAPCHRSFWIEQALVRLGSATISEFKPRPT
jgi:hypothetical protein